VPGIIRLIITDPQTPALTGGLRPPAGASRPAPGARLARLRSLAAWAIHSRTLSHQSAVRRPQSPVWPVWLGLGVVVAAFLVRLPGVAEPLGPDQGVYTTIAWGLQRGLTLYRDLWEQKPPGIYLTYVLGFVIFGARESTPFWIDYVAAAAATVLLFDLCRRLVTVRFGALASAVYALATLPAARHSLGGFLERSVTETFIVPLAIAAAWATVLALSRRQDAWSFAAGLALGVAVVFKQTAGIYWPALALWAWVASDLGRAGRHALVSGAGLAVAPVAALIWIWAQGVMSDVRIALVEYNLAYLALGGEGLAGTLDRFAHEVWRRMKTDEVWAVGTLGVAVAAITWRRWRDTPRGRLAALGVVWLAAAFVAVVANGPRMFMTYFLPSLVPLSLLIAWLLDETLGSQRRGARVAGLLVLVLAAVMVARSGSWQRGLSMTAWNVQHLTGRIDRETYLRRFQGRDGRAFSAADNARLAEYVRARTNPDDRLFVFGMSAGTYFLSGRLPASKFLWAYPAVSNMLDRPEFRVETLADDLGRVRPRYIMLQRYNGDSYSGWRAVDSFASPPMQELLRGYHHEADVGHFAVYRRIDG
jgi:4-amino-4-deoxy-L-arabinose transferase-like glycosyltransferase